MFGRPYTLEDLISRILADLREQAEAYFGHPIRRVTAGRPVRFAGAETAADDAFAVGRLRAAYRKAGFEEVTFELEPLAAAAAFPAGLAQGETILIGDFGGGTSDFSLLRAGAPGTAREVLATSGLPFAGDAFDARLVRHLVAPALGSESGGARRQVNSRAAGVDLCQPGALALSFISAHAQRARIGGPERD